MEKSNSSSVFLESLKAGVLSFVFSCAFVLLLALVGKIFSLNQSVLSIVNQILKVVSVALGSLLFLHDSKLVFKAILTAFIYSLLSFILFCVMGGSVAFGQVALDFVLSLVASVIVVLIKNKARN